MSAGINESTRVVVQGITGREGSFHTRQCILSGTNIVAGVSPGKGGEKFDGNIPVYNTVSQAVEEDRANTALVFVPAVYAGDAILESVFAGIKTVVCITEGIPFHAMLKVKRIANTFNTLLIGPNCPGIIVPGTGKLGIMPTQIFSKGHVGMISRSGTLLYEAADQVCRNGLGISTAVGIGGDPIIGSDFIYWLEQFEQDPNTHAIVMIGEIGGDMEERAASYAKAHITKPVFAFIAGRSAPEGKRMGHAGAIITGSAGTVTSKETAFEQANIMVIRNLALIGQTVSENLSLK